MSYIVKIKDRKFGLLGPETYPICQERDLRPDRPCYPNAKAGHNYWFLSDEAHQSIKGDYQILYRNPHWLIDIENADSAMLFKLAWGDS